MEIKKEVILQVNSNYIEGGNTLRKPNGLYIRNCTGVIEKSR
jgi:hypothetical protein